MRGTTKIGWVWSAAAAVWLAALVAAATVWNRGGAAASRLTEKADIVRQIEDLRRSLTPGVEAMRLHREWNANELVALTELMRTSEPPLAADDAQTSEEEVGAEWRMVRSRLSFGAVPVAQAMNLVERAETQRPPWRLSRIAIRPLPGDAGKADVSLEMQALVPR